MPRVVEINFDVNGRTTGTESINCGSSVTGTFRVVLAWDKAEQTAGRTVRATVKLIRPVWIFKSILIRDKVPTASAADPIVPGYTFKGPYDVLGPLLGWKPTQLTTTYTYECDSNCNLTITSSRGGSFNTNDDEESVAGLITLRDAGRKYERRSAAQVDVECVPSEVALGDFSFDPEKEALAALRNYDRALAIRMQAERDVVETSIAEAMETVLVEFKEPKEPPKVVKPASPKTTSGKRGKK
jgi:hypothetical protein